MTWKETKNAGLFRMISEPAERDPHPELPAALADPRRVADFAELAARTYRGEQVVSVSAARWAAERKA